jgi:hypothetical protein
MPERLVLRKYWNSTNARKPDCLFTNRLNTAEAESMLREKSEVACMPEIIGT